MDTFAEIRKKAEEWFREGFRRYERERYAEAIAYYDKALATNVLDGRFLEVVLQQKAEAIRELGENKEVKVRREKLRDLLHRTEEILKNEKERMARKQEVERQFEKQLEKIGRPTYYPRTDEIFKLTLDGDAPQNDPLAIVKVYGYNCDGGWRYNGKKVEGEQTHRFKLIQLDFCHDLDEVVKKLKVHGEIPGGQWCMAFRSKYPASDDNCVIGIADASWVSPHGYPNFPAIDAGSIICFNSTSLGFLKHWRWLVVSE